MLKLQNQLLRRWGGGFGMERRVLLSIRSIFSVTNLTLDCLAFNLYMYRDRILRRVLNQNDTVALFAFIVCCLVS